MATALPDPVRLDARARTLASHLPPLLAAARRLAASAQAGVHGRRRAGAGEDFWQFRQAVPGDPARSIDWRRSARAERMFIRQREWQAPQSVYLWVDHGQSMNFTGDDDRPTKADRAALIAMALGVLLMDGGERVGLLGDTPIPAGAGDAHAHRIARALAGAQAEEDHAPMHTAPVKPGAHILMLSDFLGPEDVFRAVIDGVSKRGVQGQFLQILDPVEEEFPFRGRTILHSVSGRTEFETLRADELRAAYLRRLGERKDTLAALSRRTGWPVGHHLNARPALEGLMWAWRAVARAR